MTAQQQSNGTSLIVQGRIVWTMGRTLFEGKPKLDMNTKRPVIDPQTGQQVLEFGFGLAIPKVNEATGQHYPEFVRVWQALHAEAATIYPNGLPPGFAMKFKDGDGVDHNGQPFNTREGYKNHIVLSCTTRIPIKYFIFQDGANVQVTTGIKCGDYVEVQLNLKAHPAAGTAKPGLYLNPGAVRLITPGAEIINAPSADQMFGTQAATYGGQVVPPSANMGVMPGATPAAPQAPAYPAAPAMPGMPPAAPAAPAMPGMPPAAPQAPAYPAAPAAPAHYGVLPGNMQPQAPAYPAAPQAPAYPAMPGMPPVR